VNAYLSDYGSETLFIFRFDPGIHTGRLTPENARASRSRSRMRSHRAILSRGARVTASVYPRFEEQGPNRGPSTARYLSKEVAGIDYNGTLPSTEEVFNSSQNTDGSSATRKTCIAPTSPSSGPTLPKLSTRRTMIRSENLSKLTVSYEVIGS